MLRGSKVILGLGVNFLKSILISINLNVHFLAAATNFQSCRIEDKAFIFLGIPIRSIPKRILSWKPLLSKLKARLYNCKGRFINFGGRITLLKSVLSSISIFHLSFYRAPVKICKDI